IRPGDRRCHRAEPGSAAAWRRGTGRAAAADRSRALAHDSTCGSFDVWNTMKYTSPALRPGEVAARSGAGEGVTTSTVPVAPLILPRMNGLKRIGKDAPCRFRRSG